MKLFGRTRGVCKIVELSANKKATHYIQIVHIIYISATHFLLLFFVFCSKIELKLSHKNEAILSAARQQIIYIQVLLVPLVLLLLLFVFRVELRFLDTFSHPPRQHIYVFHSFTGHNMSTVRWEFFFLDTLNLETTPTTMGLPPASYFRPSLAEHCAPSPSSIPVSSLYNKGQPVVARPGCKDTRTHCVHSIKI